MGYFTVWLLGDDNFKFVYKRKNYVEKLEIIKHLFRKSHMRIHDDLGNFETRIMVRYGLTV